MGRNRIVLLDTCALLWLTHDQEQISAETLEEMNRAPLLYVSAITGFEIGIKYKTGKLQLPVPPKDWLEGVMAHHDLSVINLDMAICLKSTQLPTIHKDPCDRFIIATSLVRGLPVITADKRFAEYGVKVLI
jgi:PIN domain nuclease of toxin-antitoxin system